MATFLKASLPSILPAHPAMHELTHHWHTIYHSAAGMALHGLLTLPLMLAASGVLAWHGFST